VASSKVRTPNPQVARVDNRFSISGAPPPARVSGALQPKGILQVHSFKWGCYVPGQCFRVDVRNMSFSLPKGESQCPGSRPPCIRHTPSAVHLAAPSLNSTVLTTLLSPHTRCKMLPPQIAAAAPCSPMTPRKTPSCLRPRISCGVSASSWSTRASTTMQSCP